MANEVFVDKTTLFNILGADALSVAMFMASGSQEGTALRIMLDNVDRIDLNCDLMQQQLIPLLASVGAMTQTTVNNINSFVSTTLG